MVESSPGVTVEATESVRKRMDDMYRLQRHIYDFSRRYYLLGRDRLIADLALRPGEQVCEIGCGTGRNLVMAARRYPDATLYGLDASAEMLKTARSKMVASRLDGRITLAQGFAERFDPHSTFGVDRPFDRIVFSYSLSMIPPWREALDKALASLKPGGSIHIVDFGDQAGLPPWFRRLLFTWLNLFGVHVRPELVDHLQNLGDSGRAAVDLRAVARGYAFRADLRLPRG